MNPDRRDRLWRDIDAALDDAEHDPAWAPKALRPSTDYLPKRISPWRLGVIAGIASISVLGFALVVLQCSERYPTQ